MGSLVVFCLYLNYYAADRPNHEGNRLVVFFLLRVSLRTPKPGFGGRGEDSIVQLCDPLLAFDHFYFKKSLMPSKPSEYPPNTRDF